MKVSTVFSITVWSILSLGAFWRIGGNHVFALLLASLVLIVFPVLFNTESRPAWARRVILLLALFYFSIPFFLAPLKLFCGQNFQNRGTTLVGLFVGVPTDSLIPVFIDFLLYLIVSIFWMILIFSLPTSDEFPRIKIKFSSLMFFLWCFGFPMLLGFDYQMQIIYWMAGAYYASSLVSRAPVVDLFFSCCCILVLPLLCIISRGDASWEWDLFLTLFGYLFENSDSRIFGTLVLAIFPTLFLGVKFCRVWKNRAQGKLDEISNK